MDSLKTILSKRLVIATPAFVASLILHILVVNGVETSGYGMLLSNCLLAIGAIICVSGFLSHALDKYGSEQ